MSADDRADPSTVYARRDPGVDPPTITFALDVERQTAEGDIVLFVDDEPDPSRAFELHRIGGAFRISDRVAPPRGAFASAQVAIAAGWAMVDAAAARQPAGLPPIGALVDEDDQNGGFR